MIKTTFQYFCDKCGKETHDDPDMQYTVDERFSFGGDCFASCINITFGFKQYGDINPKDNILCNDCKIKALEELLEKLKEKEQSK